MSRTYRKNLHWFLKDKGEFYNTYAHDKTIKGKASRYIKSDWKTRDYPWGANHFKEIVTVCDSDSCGNGCGGKNKKMLHRIDRSRYRQALYNNENTYIKTSFDIWDYS